MQQGRISTWLLSIERLGNRLPEPATLFLILIAMVMLMSVLASLLGWSVVHPGNQEVISANNLFAPEQLRRLLVEMPEIFAGFPPLGEVLAVMLGIGVADKTGLIAATLRLFISYIPSWLLSSGLVFAGIMSSLAADAGYVVLIPIGALLFFNAGRHPLAGLAATFAGVSAGFSANLVLTSLDPLLAGITEASAHIIAADYAVSVTANYYLMLALVPIFTLVGAVVTEKIVEPMLGAYVSGEQLVVSHEETATVGSSERNGLLAAAVTLAVLLLFVAYLVVPEGAVLRDEQGSIKPFYHSMITLMLLLFFVPGLVYGIVVRKIRNDKDVVDMTAGTMSDMGSYIVLAFFAAHFIVLFKWSNLGVILAISGASTLEALGFTGLALIVVFILLTGTINLFVGSASAKWAIMAPVFVPMLMLLGYSPELTQAAYRIGDSMTNILTPLLPYFPLIIIFARRYQKDFGIGSLISIMLPYSIGFGIFSSLLLVLWIFLALPLGPDSMLTFGAVAG